MKYHVVRIEKGTRCPQRTIVFEESSCFNLGFNCFDDCCYLNEKDIKDGKAWCRAWERYIDDPYREAENCSKRPAYSGR